MKIKVTKSLLSRKMLEGSRLPVYYCVYLHYDKHGFLNVDLYDFCLYIGMAVYVTRPLCESVCRFYVNLAKAHRYQPLLASFFK